MKLTMQDLKRRSTKAVCGPFEREVVVEKKNIDRVINTIKNSGTHFYVGKGPTFNPNKKKVWFNPRGGL